MNKLDALLAQFSPEEIATGEITGKPPKGLLEVSTPQDIRARVEQIMIGKQIGAMLRDARVKRGLWQACCKSAKPEFRNSSKPTPTSS
jgi:hypothetical protein